MTDLVCVGINHHTAPVDIRERISFPAPRLGTALAAARQLPGVGEVVIVSTCNRVEVYAAGAEPQVSTSIARYLHAEHGMAPGTLDGHLFTHTGDEAVRHLFRVAASLDALVVGEPQILGQVKDAFRAAMDAHTLGSALTRVFHRAFTVAKRVRTETGIAQSAVSVSFAAVELARTIFGGLRGSACLLLGAGNMAELAARHFVQDGAELWICNRSYDRAVALAAAEGGTARTWADLGLLLEKADIVLCSTAAQGHVLTREMLPQVMRARRYKPLFIIDIAVPRNVDPGVTEVENVYAYDVDDLGRVVDDNREKRRREAQKAEGIVGAELDAFRAWWAGRAVVPTIKALRTRADAVVDAELKRTLAHLPASIGERELRSITAMAHAVANKLLHDPLAQLRHSAEHDEGSSELAEAARRLFQLEVPTDEAVATGPSAADQAAEAEAREALKAADEAQQVVAPGAGSP